MSARAAVLALALTLAPALSGCESTQEESAKLERSAKHVKLSQQGLSIARASTKARVLEATVVHGTEGAAAAVTVLNTSGQTLREVPLAIVVESANGQVLYRNDAPGLEAALTHVSSLPAHAALTWVDDQIPARAAGAAPASVSATLGEAPAASATGAGAPPRVAVTDVHLVEAATGEAQGTVRNSSPTAQQRLVVFVTARRAGRVVAAGRALLPSVGAGASAPFQAFLIGSPTGATLQASATATTFG